MTFLFCFHQLHFHSYHATLYLSLHDGFILNNLQSYILLFELQFLQQKKRKKMQVTYLYSEDYPNLQKVVFSSLAFHAIFPVSANNGNATVLSGAVPHDNMRRQICLSAV
jgi:hypothetical protein